jgi:chemotaxis methyl-accepting protein methylase
MNPSVAARIARVRLFGKSPVNAYVKLNYLLWSLLPPSVTGRIAMRRYASFLHRLVRLGVRRQQNFGTFFLRNRPLLALIRSLAQRYETGSTLTIAFIGCSNGAELYSVLWTIRSARPDLKIVAHAVDISKEILAIAERGTYSLTAVELVPARIFERMTEAEMQAMFDRDAGGDTVTVKPQLREGISWYRHDAASADLPALLGKQDMVVANNFLCHMDPPGADGCLRNVARLVRPGGYLFVSGVDLDVRTQAAYDLRLRPVRESIEEIHDGDPPMRKYWPWSYWSLEPLDKSRPDWPMRYACAFQVAEGAR